MTWATPAIIAVRGYRRCLSPWLPPSCRFHPSCSEYAETALRVHGLGRGVALALWRLARCQPFCAGGFDPVPPRASAGRRP